MRNKAPQPTKNALAEMHASTIDAFAVLDLFHEFHQKTARDLWVTYQRMDLELATQTALLDDVITPEELPATVRKWFVERVEQIKHRWESSADDEADSPDIAGEGDG